MIRKPQQVVPTPRCKDYLTFHLLVDRPEAVPVVATWYYYQWGLTRPGNSVESAIERLRGKLHRDNTPLHLVAIRADTVVGVAQLKRREMDIYPEKEFWLGGVYVPPEARGHGIGSALCEQIAGQAEEHGIKELYLYTPILGGGLYRRLGWRMVEVTEYRGVQVAVMVRNLSGTKSNEA